VFIVRTSLPVLSVIAGLFLLVAGCFSWPGSSGSGDDDTVFGDDDIFGDDDSASDDDDTGGSGDDDTGGSGDDDTGGSGDDDTGGSGDDDTGGSGDDDDTGGSGDDDDDSSGSGDDDTGDDDTGGPGDDDDTPPEGSMSLTAPQGTAFSPLSTGQAASLGLRIENASQSFVLWNLQLQVDPNNGNGTVFLFSGGLPQGSMQPVFYEERDLVFSPQAGISYTATVSLFHGGTNVDGSDGRGPDGIFQTADDVPATLVFTANVASGTESDCDDGIDNDTDNLTDCLDDDCFTTCPCGEFGCCDDGIDNDTHDAGVLRVDVNGDPLPGDGDTDCADSDCQFDPACNDFCCFPGGPTTNGDCLDTGCRNTVCAADPDCCSVSVGWIQACADAYTACSTTCQP